MDTSTLQAMYDKGEITLTELTGLMLANAKADAEAANIARNGTANSLTIISDIR